MTRWIPLLAAALMAAGCLADGPSGPNPEGPRPGPGDLASGLNLLPLNAPTTYAVVETYLPTGTLVARENPGQQKSTEKEIYLRIVNRDGKLFNHTFRVPALGAGALTEYEFDYPPNPPYLLSVECGCAFVWLKNTDQDPARHLGPAEFVKEVNQSIVVQYDAATTTDVTQKSPLEDERTFELNASVIHWGFLWAFNLRGNVTLFTPSGIELAHWELDGRQTLGGHTSNGSTPLEVGRWTLRMQGHGWFELQVRTGHLATESWNALGISAPSG